jgi:tRNA(Ile)-lysidine synthase
MTRRRTVRSGFEQRFLASMRRCGIEHGQRLIVGFSGGPDSLALALALRRTAPLLDLVALLVHIDHGLRAGSAEDVTRARELAATVGFPFRSLALEPGLPARSPGLGIEEQARRERYVALASAATDWGADSILLGHQADDQAETVLLHLIRGSGLRGLGGMRLAETRSIPWWSDGVPQLGEFRILRPLLTERRQTIETYLAELDAAPLLDESNFSDEFDRNWVRRRVLPVIESRWPGAVETITRSAEAARLDNDFLSLLLEQSQDPGASSDRTISVDWLLEIEPALAYRRIARWLIQVGIEEPGFDVVARVYAFVGSGDESTSIEIGSGIPVVVANRRLMTFEDLVSVAETRFPVHLPGEPTGWAIEMVDRVEGTDGWTSVALPTDLSVRALQAGDRWAGTNRKVMDDLRAAGIHPLLRTSVLAVTGNDGVLLIPAIYPTIHSVIDNEGVTMSWVRWRKV